MKTTKFKTQVKSPGNFPGQKEKSMIHLIQNFTTMKKLMLTLIIAIIAVGFSTQSTYGQLVPRAITCLTADHLHPIAGQPYTYEITVPTPPGNKNIIWMATQSTTFITGGALVATPELPGTSEFLAGAGAAYNAYTINQFTMSLTWKSFTYDPAQPVFVIVNVINADGTCSPNNMKVWKIMPINAFTLDIDNRLSDNSGLHTGTVYGDDYQRCQSIIASAVYDPNAVGDPDDDGVIYDFGRDSLYFEIVAANWAGAWKPSFTVAGVDPLETILKVVWSTTSNFVVENTTTLVAGVYVADGLVTPSGGATGSVGAAGESIYVKVLIAHNNFEGAAVAGETITVATDGELYYIENPAGPPPYTYASLGIHDIHWDNGTTPPCVYSEDGFTNDWALQTIIPRPDVNEGPGIGPFLPIEP